MAFSTINTHGFLDRWQVIADQRPYAFHQVNDLYLDSAPEVWIQSERDSLASTVTACMNTATHMLGYSPVPHYVSRRVELKRGRAWYDQVLYLGEGKLIEFGSRATALVDDAVSVVYSDLDGDGTNDTATVTVTTAELESGTLELYFTVGDGRPQSTGVDARYRIYPSEWDYNGTAYVFTIPRWRMVKPTLYRVAYDGNERNTRRRYPVDNAQDGVVFVSTVDAYRVYTSNTDAVQLIQPPVSPDTVETTETVLPILVNGDLGKFALQHAELADVESPCAVQVNFLAGQVYDDPMLGTVASDLEVALVRHTLVESPLNAIAAGIKISDKWAGDGQYLKNLPTPLGSRVIDHYLYQVYGARAQYNGAMKGRR